MQITVISVGKLKEKPYRQMADEYLKRLSRFGKVEETELPDEMGFIGFDNTAYAEMATPKLTTLGHPKEAFGSLAAEKLLRMIDGERERSVNMAWTLVERDSLPRVERL